LLVQGMNEGSIRNDLDAHNTSMLIGNLFTGMMQRMALRGEILAREQNIDPKAQLIELIDMIIAHISVD
jgi:hypothetical protein